MELEQKTTEKTANAGVSVPSAGHRSKANMLLALAAAGEVVTGLALMAAPVIVVRLLMGVEPSGAGIAMSRVAGIALFALGLGCWPVRDAAGSVARALGAMLTYSLLVAIYLFYLGIGGKLVGLLLWPAVAVHAVLTLLLAGAWLKTRQTLR